MKTERIYKPKEEIRGWYFVQYYPPSFDKYAHLQLTITIENAVKNDIITAMEKEAEIWFNQFPVPLLVSAFDNTETPFDFSEIKEQNILMGLVNNERKLCLYWSPLKNEENLNNDLSKEYIDSLYSGFSFTTGVEYDTDRKKRRQQIETGFVLFLLLPFAITVIYESFIYFNGFFSLLAFLYILYKAVRKSLDFVGIRPKSKREKDKEIEERLKEHYYYYCKNNPEGFERLRSESIEKMAKEAVKKEAEALRIKKQSP
ncbi:MAG: hypothetical protein HZB50_10645 [Chloroflexi bacterium]|nr:hypothetical protein [Chloroflexota bacterium]